MKGPTLKDWLLVVVSLAFTAMAFVVGRSDPDEALVIGA